MKQTNNAIKFLMAQYRAIFKNANIAMLAAIAASALAAGQAQAAAASATVTKWSEIPTAAGTTYDGTNQKITITATNTDKENQTAAGGFDIVLTGGTSGTNFIKGNQGKNAFGPAPDAETAPTTSITLNASTGKADGAYLDIGAAADASAEVTVTNVKNLAGTLTVTGGTKASKLLATNIQIGPDAQASRAGEAVAVVALAGSGEIGSATNTEKFDILTGGELKFTAAKAKAASKSGINLNGGKITVVAAATDAAIEGKLNVNNGTVDVAEDGVLTVSGLTTVNSGTVTVSGAESKKGTLTLNGGLTQNGGKIDLKAAKTGGILNVSGNTLVTDGEFSIGSGAVAKFQGNAEFAKDKLTVANGAKIQLGDDLKKGATRTLKVDSSNIKGMLATAEAISGSGAAGSKFVLQLTDSDVIDLSSADANVVKDADGTVSDGIKIDTATLVIKGDKAKFHAKELLTGATQYDFNTLAVGSGASATEQTFKLDGKSVLTVRNALTAKDNGSLKTLTIADGTLNLVATDGVTGTVKADAIVLNHNDSKLGVDGGVWNVKDLTLTSGNATISNAEVDVAGTLSIGDQAGSLTATASIVDVSGTPDDSTGVVPETDKAKLSVKKAQGIKLANTSELHVKASDIFKVEGGKLTVEAKDFVQNGVSGDATTALELKGFTGTLTEEQLQELVAGVGFGGVISGIKVDVKAQDGVSIDKITAGSDAYKDTVVTVDKEVAGTYSVEGVSLGSTQTELSIAKGSMTLNNPESGKFVAKGNDVAGVKLTDASSALVLAGSGEIGAIDAKASGNGSVTIGQLSDGGKVAIGAVGATNQVGTLTVNENVNLTANGAVKVGTLTVDQGVSLNANGDITAEAFSFKGKTLNADGKTITVGGAGKKVEILGGDITAKSLTLATGHDSDVVIAGGANLDLGKLSAIKDKTIAVGQGGADGLGAVVDTDVLALNSGTIFIDPEYGKAASVVFAKSFTDANVDNETDAGLMGGKAVVGANAALAVGFDSEEAARQVLGQYLTNKDGFESPAAPATLAAADAATTTKVANALVLNKQISVGEKDGILVDTSKTYDPTKQVTASDNNVTVGANSALIITDNVYTTAAGGEKQGAAIKFTHSTSGSVSLDASSSVILSGDFDAKDNGLKIFDRDASVSTSKAPAITGNGAKVYSLNGMLSGVIGTDGTVSQLQFKDNGVAYRDASAPVTQMMLNKVKGEYKQNAGKGMVGYDYLTELSKGDSAAALDAVTHAATYAGAQQAAVASVTTMADAMFGRVGAVGVEAASISATGSQANGGVWVSPMYKSVDSDGFGSQGASYGSDVDLAGVAFGADTVNGNMRFGAVFNIGSGDAEGKGQGNGLKDEFDYYGFGIYSAMGFGNFALVGDASLTVISHDVEGFSGVQKFGNARGEADTTAVTMGLTGQYTFATPAVDVTPHLGARFIRLKTDSYDVNSDLGVIATTDFEVQNVFSVPLGVTLSKAFVAGGWSLAPSADLTLTFNTGDTEAKSSTYVYGAEGLDLTAEVLDEVTYGLTVGLGAQYGAFGTSFGINYTGSSNTDSFGVNAQARYMF